MKRKRGRPKKSAVKKPSASAAAAAVAVANTDEEAFLNFVGQNVLEKSQAEQVNDNGLSVNNNVVGANGSNFAVNSNGFGIDGNNDGFGKSDSEVDSFSSSSSSSGESDADGFHFGEVSSSSDEPAINRRANRTTTKRSRTKRQKPAKVNLSNSKGFTSSSRKELRQMKNPAQDSRFNKKELKASLAVIKKVMEMNEAAPFNAPVDPVSQGILDYFNAIDTPMDFRTICSNLQNGLKYLSSEDVYKDVEYIWENCRKYNKKGDYIVYLMKRVKKKFMKYWTAAGLCSEILRKPSGHFQLAPSSDHAMRYNRHDPVSTVNHLANNPIQMQQNNFGTGQPQPKVPLPSYSQPYQSHHPQPSTTQVPQFSQFQAGVNGSYAGYSHITGPPVRVLPKEWGKHTPKHPAAPMVNGPTHSQQHQPQPSSCYLWQSQPTTGQPQPSQSYIGSEINNAGHLPLLPYTDCAMTRNGGASRCSMDPMYASMKQPQPQHQLPAPCQPSESHYPRASVGLHQPSQPLASVDISSAGMKNLDASSWMGRTRSKRHPAGPDAEIALISGHSPPQQPSVCHNLPSREQLSTHVIKRKVRGPTRCRFMLDMHDGERIFVPMNTLGQPVGPEASKLASFLGTIARNGKMAPLNCLDWSAVPETNKEDMWQLVQAKFDMDPLCKIWVMKSLASKWRNWKAKLKAAHYNPHTTDEERLKDCNKRVLPDQWAALIAHWNSEEVQVRSAKNKANRAKQKSTHAAGSKSFARIREEQAKRSDGKELTRGELYILTRTRKDGKPINKGAAEIISKLQDQATQKRQTSNSSNDYADTYCQVMGEDKHGHASMVGLGPTPSEPWGRKPSRNSLMTMALEAKRSANGEVSKMLNKMETMEQKYASLEAQIARMTSNMQTLIEKMGVVGSEQVPNNAAVGPVRTQAQSSSSSHAVRI